MTLQVYGPADGTFQRAYPNLVAPFNPILIDGLAGMSGANQGRTVRVVVPKTGRLRDVSFFAGAQSGNYDIGVLDTGDASAGNYSLLASKGSTASPAANAGWVSWDPNLAVTAGQQIQLILSYDNGTATWGKISTAASSSVNPTVLPTSFIPTSGGAAPKLAGVFASVFPLATGFASPVAEASMTMATAIPVLIARVS